MMEFKKNMLHVRREDFREILTHGQGDAPDGFSDAADDGAEGIGIGAEADGHSDGILKAGSHTDDLQCHWDGALAGFVETVEH